MYKHLNKGGYENYKELSAFIRTDTINTNDIIHNNYFNLQIIMSKIFHVVSREIKGKGVRDDEKY